MTEPYGMIDLASLKKPAAGAAGAGASRPSAHEVAVTEQGLEQLVADSQRTPTLILVTSPRVAEGEQFLGGLGEQASGLGEQASGLGEQASNLGNDFLGGLFDR